MSYRKRYSKYSKRRSSRRGYKKRSKGFKSGSRTTIFRQRVGTRL